MMRLTATQWAAVALAVAIALLVVLLSHSRPAALAPKEQPSSKDQSLKDQSWVAAGKGDLERKPARLIPLTKPTPPAPAPFVASTKPTDASAPALVEAAVQMPPARDEPPEADEPALTAPRGPVRRVRVHHAEGGGDVCSRHGGHKVELRRGRSWRCVFGRR